MNEVIIPESVKQDFESWYLATYHKGYENQNDFLLGEFEAFPYDFQSGVYKAYLRSVGIYVKVERRFFNNILDYRGECQDWARWLSDHNEAEIAAINEGMKLRAQQLTDK